MSADAIGWTFVAAATLTAVFGFVRWLWRRHRWTRVDQRAYEGAFADHCARVRREAEHYRTLPTEEP